MPWSRKLSEPITLKDGRVITTLDDARAFMLGLSERRQMTAYWQYAAKLVWRAAAPRSSKEAMLEAWAQLRRALHAEGKL